MPCGSGFGKRSQNKRPPKYSKTSTPKLLSEAHFDRYDLCTTHTGSHPWRGRQGTDKGNSQPFRGSGKDFFDRSILGRDVAVNLVPVGVVVGQGRVNLRERKVLDFGGDLLGSQTEVVPAGNAPDRDAGTGDAGPALADFWRPLDQCSNIDNGGHFLRSILLARRRPAQRFRRRPELLSRRLLSRDLGRVRVEQPGGGVTSQRLYNSGQLRRQIGQCRGLGLHLNALSRSAHCVSSLDTVPGPGVGMSADAARRVRAPHHAASAPPATSFPP